MSEAKELPRRAVLNNLFRYHGDGTLTWRYDRGVNGIKAGDPVGQLHRDGYMTVRVGNGGHWRLHRVIWKMHYDSEPAIIDHIDRDRTNNRIENLRAASRAQNKRNTAASGKRSKFKGVYPKGDRWQARITMDRKTHYFGTFDTPEEAAQVVDEWARVIDPTYSQFNFPENAPAPEGGHTDNEADRASASPNKESALCHKKP